MAITSKMAIVLITLMAVCLLLSGPVTGQRRGKGGGGGGGDSGSNNLSSSDYGFFCLLISSLSYIVFLYSPY
uniref:Uncharacterized protein n=1 Tax=Solanum lycopersicum TaxID=4081 RepID=A0A3Q7J1Q0_SOLLC